MSGDMFRPVVPPEAFDTCVRGTRAALDDCLPHMRPAILRGLLGVYAELAVAEVGREEAGALIRGAAADAGAVLTIVRDKPRRRAVRQILEWFCCFVAGWLLFEIVRVASAAISGWLRGVI